MLRDVAADDFLEGLNDVIGANASQTERDAIEPQVSEFATVVTTIGETKEAHSISSEGAPSSPSTAWRRPRSRARGSIASCSRRGSATTRCRQTSAMLGG